MRFYSDFTLKSSEKKNIFTITHVRRKTKTATQHKSYLTPPDLGLESPPLPASPKIDLNLSAGVGEGVEPGLVKAMDRLANGACERQECINPKKTKTGYGIRVWRWVLVRASHHAVFMITEAFVVNHGLQSNQTLTQNVPA